MDQMKCDKQFYVLLLLGPVFWAVLFLFVPITQNLLWPFSAPGKFLLLTFLYPIVEEVVFRGLVQDFFSNKFKNKKISVISYANILTSIIFVLLHFLYHPWAWAVAVIVPSLIFGYSKERYSSLLAPIVLHIIYNMGYYWLYN